MFMIRTAKQATEMLPIYRRARAMLAATLLTTISLLSPISTLAAHAQPAPLTDGYFVWDARELSIADAQAAIRQFPKLAAHEALILDRCGLHSVNPRLAALLLTASGTLDEFDARDVDAIGKRIDSFLTALPHVFYLGRNASASTQCHQRHQRLRLRLFTHELDARRQHPMFLQQWHRTRRMEHAHAADRYGVEQNV